ncbi:MAG: DNA topoisomerase III [Elusimicrobia bacterium]|nr:DNA topoisomerase III [Elusimicrobiota bacterium]
MANAKFMKPVQPDADLAAVVGSNPLPRTEIIKKLWDYIKAKGLQDKVNKRNINADATLLKLFGKNQVNMFELAGIISKHVK